MFYNLFIKLMVEVPQWGTYDITLDLNRFAIFLFTTKLIFMRIQTGKNNE